MNAALLRWQDIESEPSTRHIRNKPARPNSSKHRAAVYWGLCQAKLYEEAERYYRCAKGARCWSRWCRCYHARDRVGVPELAAALRAAGAPIWFVTLTVEEVYSFPAVRTFKRALKSWLEGESFLGSVSKIEIGGNSESGYTAHAHVLVAGIPSEHSTARWIAAADRGGFRAGTLSVHRGPARSVEACIMYIFDDIFYSNDAGQIAIAAAGLKKFRATEVRGVLRARQRNEFVPKDKLAAVEVAISEDKRTSVEKAQEEQEEQDTTDFLNYHLRRELAARGCPYPPPTAEEAAREEAAVARRHAETQARLEHLARLDYFPIRPTTKPVLKLVPSLSRSEQPPPATITPVEHQPLLRLVRPPNGRSKDHEDVQHRSDDRDEIGSADQLGAGACADPPQQGEGG